MRTPGIVFAVALSLVSLRAHADAGPSKAWTAAKAGLPGDAALVIGVDFAALQKTQVYAALYPRLRDKPRIGKMLEIFKSSCKIDLLPAVQSFVVAGSSDQDVVMYVAFNGVERTKLTSCLQIAGKQEAKGARFSIKQDGDVTQITESDGTSFLGWAGKDVLVIAGQGTDRAALARWMGGHGALARSELGKFVAKVDTSAAMWGAGRVGNEVAPGLTVKTAYGAVKFASARFDADIHAMAPSSSQAAAMAELANQKIAAASHDPQTPPQLTAILKGVQVAAAADELVIKARLSEADLMGVLAPVMGAL